MNPSNAKPGIAYYVGRVLQLLSLVTLGLVAIFFQLLHFLDALMFAVEASILFIIGWLMVRRWKYAGSSKDSPS